ncbi:hypothetical protein [Nocardia sp. NPDC051832]|uniref:hypothetical protein n=1 Tax=Nocardia sp. NPDC051832 TaxID=3155673 RepID=UPI0034394BED
MHVMAVSAVSDNDGFWNALKQAHVRMPKGSRWTLAVASADGAKAVNLIVGESLESVQAFFDSHAGSFAATEFFEADAANAVGLPK